MEPEVKEDVFGASLEAGIALVLNELLSANAGYKRQSFSGDGTHNVFSGFTGGFNYIF
jgi:hypothetical protein